MEAELFLYLVPLPGMDMTRESEPNKALRKEETKAQCWQHLVASVSGRMHGGKCSPRAGSKLVQRIKQTAAWPQEVPRVWQCKHFLHLLNHLSVCRDRRQDQAGSLHLSPLLSLALPLSLLSLPSN